MNDAKKSFLAGYNSTKQGYITSELTNREIANSFPAWDISAFAQGMVDALSKDDFRFKIVRDQVSSLFRSKK